MPYILIVEDEGGLPDTLLYALQAEGSATTWVTSPARRWRCRARQFGGSADPRRRSAGHQRLPRPAARQRRFSEVGDLPHRARCRDRPRGRRDRRRRLRGQAVQPARGGGAGQGHPLRMAPRPRRRWKRPRRAGRSRSTRSARDPLPRHPAQPHPPRVPLVADAARAASLERVFSREQLLDALGVASEAGYEQHRQPHQEPARQAAGA